MKKADDELFRLIREGDEEKAKEAFDALMANTMRGASVAIAARNFSHGVGKTMRKKKEK